MDRKLNMTNTQYISKARESIRAGFVSVQNSYDREEWFDIDPNNPGIDIDYYSCFLFANGRHIPTPMILDAVYPFWAGQYGFDENTLQIRTIRYWLKKTGLINDQHFIVIVNWVMDNYYNNHNYQIEPVEKYYRVLFTEYEERYIEVEKGKRLIQRQEAYYLCNDVIKNFVGDVTGWSEAGIDLTHWKCVFQCVASPADFLAKIIFNDGQEYWIIIENGEIVEWTEKKRRHK